MVIKTAFKDSMKVKIIQKNIKTNFLSLFPDVPKAADFEWKYANNSRYLRVCYAIYIYFGSFIGKI